jgi:hypothetical protein
VRKKRVVVLRPKPAVKKETAILKVDNDVTEESDEPEEAAKNPEK